MLIPWTLSQNFFLKAQRKYFSGWLHCVQTTETKTWLNFSVKITVLCAAGAPAVWGAADAPELCCPLLPPAAQDRHHCVRERKSGGQIIQCTLSLILITLYFIAQNHSYFYFVETWLLRLPLLWQKWKAVPSFPSSELWVGLKHFIIFKTIHQEPRTLERATHSIYSPLCVTALFMSLFCYFYSFVKLFFCSCFYYSLLFVTHINTFSFHLCGRTERWEKVTDGDGKETQMTGKNTEVATKTWVKIQKENVIKETWEWLKVHCSVRKLGKEKDVRKKENVSVICNFKTRNG